jgi:nitrite reductase/ring-hydroxylating ferredoxin subunit
VTDPETLDDDTEPAVRRRSSGEATFGVPDAWWPVALAEQVSNKPRSFRLGAQALAMYRDPRGIVRAVVDVCPHRRMPLSMGWVTEEGYLQCPYHGWCFDGATGQCMVIPNLRDDERVSPSIRVSAFATAEQLAQRLGFRHRPTVPPSVDETATVVTADHGLTLFDAKLADGFVHVWSGAAPSETVPPPSSSPDPVPSDGDTFHGEAEVRVPWQHAAEALLWNPGRALGLSVFLGAGSEMIAPSVSSDDGAVVVERERLTFALPRISTFDQLLANTTRVRISTRVDTGLTRLDAESDNGSVVARVVVGLAPYGEYRTMVRWRGHVAGGASSTAALGWTRVASVGRRLAGREGTALEATSDAAQEAVDPAVAMLRELRQAPTSATAT